MTSTNQFVWCGSLRCEVRDGSGASISQYFARGQLNGANKTYFSQDHVTSTREVTNDFADILARYSYDPFGRMTLSEGSESADFRYAQYYWHANSGLNLTFTRAYSSTLSRFINRDPIEEDGGINLYAYTNNPVGYIDPSGLKKTTLMSPAEWSSATGYPANSFSNVWGCLSLVSGVLGFPLGTWPEPQLVYPSNWGQANMPAYGTKCWWGGSGALANPASAIKQARCHECPTGFKTIYWCKQGQASNIPTQPGGTPISGNPIGLMSGNAWNYSLWDPALGYQNVLPTKDPKLFGVKVNPNFPAGSSSMYNRSYCCATCKPQGGK